MTMTTTTDRIEKEIVLRAPRSRVWRAITDSREFGAWFGVELEGSFAVGQTVTGRVTVPGYSEVTLAVLVERMEPERLFSYRWHPYAVDPKVDFSAEPMTLVEFRLEEAPGGTRLHIVESGFDRLPPHRRDEAFRMNGAGWQAQLENLCKHVEV
jgi:uncharacterized protein YndB with AHSA1/START domain